MNPERDRVVAKPGAQWVRPQLTFVGNIGEVLQGGGGKLSLTANDPGDSRKPSGVGSGA
jgi:hypothetical protein